MTIQPTTTGASTVTYNRLLGTYWTVVWQKDGAVLTYHQWAFQFIQAMVWLVWFFFAVFATIWQRPGHVSPTLLWLPLSGTGLVLAILAILTRRQTNITSTGLVSHVRVLGVSVFSRQFLAYEVEDLRLDKSSGFFGIRLLDVAFTHRGKTVCLAQCHDKHAPKLLGDLQRAMSGTHSSDGEA